MQSRFKPMEDQWGRSNSDFWNEMCGSRQAKLLGIEEFSSDSLSRFDDWYFDTYPYLQKHLETVLRPNSRVLEVGLGYGSVTTLALENSVAYTGVDIAAGPVDLANARATLLGVTTTVAIQADARDLSLLEAGSFDGAVAIGSLHHTGDFDRALSEIVRVCRDGAVVVGMVYSLFSFRNWLHSPFRLMRALVRNLRTAGARLEADEGLRWLADHDSSGRPAPSTVFFSRKALRHRLASYGSACVTGRNLPDVPVVSSFYPRLRLLLLHLRLDNLVGLDLYFELHIEHRSSSEPRS